MVSRERAPREGVERGALLFIANFVAVVAVPRPGTRATLLVVVELRRSLAVREDNRESRFGLLASLSASPKKVPYSYGEEDEKNSGTSANDWYKRESFLLWWKCRLIVVWRGSLC